MASPRTIDPDESLEDIDAELAHTEVFLRASPLTAHLVPPITALRADVVVMRAEETAFEDAVNAEEARALFIDDDCNKLVDEGKELMLAEVKGDYRAPLYRRAFAGQSPSQVKKPTLGMQLTTMRTWPSLVEGTGRPVLLDFGKRTAETVARGDEVTSAIAGAVSRLDVFVHGPRAAFVDRVNAARNLAYGQIAEIEHSQPKGTLPPAFAERFFLHSGGGALSTAELERGIVRLQKKAASYQATLAARQQKEADALKEKQDAAIADKKEQLAEAKKIADKAAKDLAVLEAELDPTKAT
jgi:hypothetical protein